VQKGILDDVHRVQEMRKQIAESAEYDERISQVDKKSVLVVELDGSGIRLARHKKLAFAR